MLNRRSFLRAAAVTAAVGCTTGAGEAARAVGADDVARRSDDPVIKPPRLKPGDTVGLINPAGPTFTTWDIEVVEESLAALGLRSVRGRHVLDVRGFLAGTDQARADDVNAMFADDSIDAILAVRGGWGSARILPLLDFDLARAHPKPLIGYSDVTALLLAYFDRAGLVTFHGPVGTSTWNEYSVDWFRRVVMDGEAVTFTNPTDKGDNLAQVDDRVEVIQPGTARGRLLGGNLSVLSAIVGSGYLPSFDGNVLFLEETHEDTYRVDRMITQLELAGILDAVSAVVFGKCSECGSTESYGALTLEQVLDDHLRRPGKPAWYGAMIGHIEDKWTAPLGVMVEVDAAAGSVRMLEPAVS